jgi:hypothetical protein
MQQGEENRGYSYAAQKSMAGTEGHIQLLLQLSAPGNVGQLLASFQADPDLQSFFWSKSDFNAKPCR